MVCVAHHIFIDPESTNLFTTDSSAFCRRQTQYFVADRRWSIRIVVGEWSYTKSDSDGEVCLAICQRLLHPPERFGGVVSLLASTSSSGDSPLVESMETLTERLAYEGYHTYGMVSHLAVGRFANLHQGFDRFRYIPPKMPSEVLRWGLGNEGAQHLKLARYVLSRFLSLRVDPV